MSLYPRRFGLIRSRISKLLEFHPRETYITYFLRLWVVPPFNLRVAQVTVHLPTLFQLSSNMTRGGPGRGNGRGRGRGVGTTGRGRGTGRSSAGRQRSSQAPTASTSVMRGKTPSRGINATTSAIKKQSTLPSWANRSRSESEIAKSPLKTKTDLSSTNAEGRVRGIPRPRRTNGDGDPSSDGTISSESVSSSDDDATSPSSEEGVEFVPNSTRITKTHDDSSNGSTGTSVLSSLAPRVHQSKTEESSAGSSTRMPSHKSNGSINDSLSGGLPAFDSRSSASSAEMIGRGEHNSAKSDTNETVRSDSDSDVPLVVTVDVQARDESDDVSSPLEDPSPVMATRADSDSTSTIALGNLLYDDHVSELGEREVQLTRAATGDDHRFVNSANLQLLLPLANPTYSPASQGALSQALGIEIGSSVEEDRRHRPAVYSDTEFLGSTVGRRFIMVLQSGIEATLNPDFSMKENLEFHQDGRVKMGSSPPHATLMIVDITKTPGAHTVQVSAFQTDTIPDCKAGKFTDKAAPRSASETVSTWALKTIMSAVELEFPLARVVLVTKGPEYLVHSVVQRDGWSCWLLSMAFLGKCVRAPIGTPKCLFELAIKDLNYEVILAQIPRLRRNQAFLRGEEVGGSYLPIDSILPQNSFQTGMDIGDVLQSLEGALRTGTLHLDEIMIVDGSLLTRNDLTKETIEVILGHSIYDTDRVQYGPRACEIFASSVQGFEIVVRSDARDTPAELQSNNKVPSVSYASHPTASMQASLPNRAPLSVLKQPRRSRTSHNQGELSGDYSAWSNPQRQHESGTSSTATFALLPPDKEGRLTSRSTPTTHQRAVLPEDGDGAEDDCDGYGEYFEGYDCNMGKRDEDETGKGSLYMVWSLGEVVGDGQDVSEEVMKLVNDCFDYCAQADPSLRLLPVDPGDQSNELDINSPAFEDLRTLNTYCSYERWQLTQRFDDDENPIPIRPRVIVRVKFDKQVDSFLRGFRNVCPPSHDFFLYPKKLQCLNSGDVVVLYNVHSDIPASVIQDALLRLLTTADERFATTKDQLPGVKEMRFIINVHTKNINPSRRQKKEALEQKDKVFSDPPDEDTARDKIHAVEVPEYQRERIMMHLFHLEMNGVITEFFGPGAVFLPTGKHLKLEHMEAVRKNVRTHRSLHDRYFATAFEGVGLAHKKFNARLWNNQRPASGHKMSLVSVFREFAISDGSDNNTVFPMLSGTIISGVVDGVSTTYAVVLNDSKGTVTSEGRRRVKDGPITLVLLNMRLNIIHWLFHFMRKVLLLSLGTAASALKTCDEKHVATADLSSMDDNQRLVIESKLYTKAPCRVQEAVAVYGQSSFADSDAESIDDGAEIVHKRRLFMIENVAKVDEDNRKIPRGVTKVELAPSDPAATSDDRSAITTESALEEIAQRRLLRTHHDGERQAGHDDASIRTGASQVSSLAASQRSTASVNILDSYRSLKLEKAKLVGQQADARLLQEEQQGTIASMNREREEQQHEIDALRQQIAQLAPTQRTNTGDVDRSASEDTSTQA